MILWKAMVQIHYVFMKCSWDHLDASIAWSTNGLDGSRRFLDRVWRLFVTMKVTLSEKVAKCSEDT